MAGQRRRRRQDKKAGNKINANDAAEVAQYAAAVAQEFKDLEKESLTGVFYGNKSYIKVTDADIKYTQTVEVEREQQDNDDEDSDKKTRRKERQAEVSFHLDIYQPTAKELRAPFELAHGVIGPAEESRNRVEIILAGALGDLNQRPPIFTISMDLFWAHYDGFNYTVNIETGEISRLEDIVSFNAALAPMFQYISDKAAILYD